MGKDPVAWCKKMQEQAADGNDAYNYFRMMEMWKSRQENAEPSK